MSWQDRDYNRGYRGRGGGVMTWLLSGTLPLFRVFGIDVRMHSSLVVCVVLGLLFGVGVGFGFQDKLSSMVALFTIVLLHEFGHCFTCRWVGGEADEIVMHPLGGLALCAPPQRPLPTFLTVAGGPAVNVLICIVCGVALFAFTGWVPGNPFTYHYFPYTHPNGALLTFVRYTYWIYLMSLSLLVFNLLPIYPLDGGQMLQAILWPRMGFYRSMKLSAEVGMFACVAGGVLALTSGNLGLVVLAALGFYTCMTLRQQLQANAPEGYETMSYAVGPQKVVRPKKKGWFVARRERREQQAIVTEAADVDRILEKVARTGMNSLSGGEKKTLQRASENQRRRDAAKAKRY